MSTIDRRVHEALDGEIARDTLPPELRRQAELLEAAATLLAATPPHGLGSVSARVMAALDSPAPRRRSRLVRWLVTPHAVVLRMRPVWSLALVAAVLLMMLLPLREPNRADLGDEEGIAQFVARFPGVGSFNDWRAGSIALEDPDHDGVWHGVVVLPTGMHEYMFVVDGERWVPDPLAGRYVEDDFGRENSVLIVQPVRQCAGC
jgi:Glycogen recognition site of AMP-activated protein kinase